MTLPLSEAQASHAATRWTRSAYGRTPESNWKPRRDGTYPRGEAAGWHVGFQLYVPRWGKPVADLATGIARPGVPYGQTHSYCVSWGRPDMPEFRK